MLLSYDPAIALLGIYPKQMKTYFHTETCAQMFIAALLITAKNWEVTQVSFSGLVVKKIVVYLYYGILPINEKEQTSDT